MVRKIQEFYIAKLKILKTSILSSILEEDLLADQDSHLLMFVFEKKTSQEEREMNEQLAFMEMIDLLVLGIQWME